MKIPVSCDALRRFPALSKLSDAQLQWFLDRGVFASYAAGEYVAHRGDPAEEMFFILEGTFHALAEGNENPMFILHEGSISGFLPFSRMTQYPVSTRAHTELRLLKLHRDHFPALYQDIPEVIPALVGILTDRVRETTRATTQTDKLAAIGKLSAGLAHELNNPAAAARQASASAKQIFDCYRETLDQLAARCASAEVYEEVRALEARASTAVHENSPIDSLTRSDIEEGIASWLESIGIEDPWRVAPAFANAGFSAESVAEVTCGWAPEIRELALYRVAAAIEMEQVLSQMDTATSRMSNLVGAMKNYSFMDRASTADIDINQNLEATLTMFSYRFKGGIQLLTSYAPDLPKVPGQGGQLNQVWTNLIDNALDAMESEQGRSAPGELLVRTQVESNQVLIEISDNGPGIPPEIGAKVFDPFFTTKPQGEGTGLGLDTVYRIIRQHQGDIRFDSVPGRTTFAVRLPFRKAS